MPNPDFADLEIRILEQAERGYPVEITLNAQQEFACGYLPFSIVPWLPGGDPVADGQRLFETLLTDPAVREAWATARGQSPRRRVRLRLDADAAELHALPWELLHDAEKWAHELDLKYPLPEIHSSRAQICLARAQYVEALAYAEKPVRCARDLGLHYKEGSALRVLGQVQQAYHQLPAALTTFERSGVLLSGRDPYELACTQAAWGGALLTNQLDREHGKALLLEARLTFERLGAQRDLAALEEV